MNDTKSQKILITGSKGFVGKHLCRFLTVKGFNNLIELEGSAKCDLRNSEFVRLLMRAYHPQIVIHLAARVGGILANRDNPVSFLEDNLKIGQNVIAEAYAVGTKRIIMLNTVCAYPKFCPAPFQEVHLFDGKPEETNQYYSAAKRLLITLLEAYYQQYHLESITLIPTNLYGPECVDNHVIPDITRKMLRAKTFEENTVVLYGNGTSTRDFLHVDDCINGIYLAIINDKIKHDIFNLGTQCGVSIRNLATKIASLIGYKGEIKFSNNGLDGQPNRIVSFAKAEMFLKWRPKVNWDNGLQHTITWYINNQEKLKL